jgi:thiamine pyrophosphokinase
MNKIMIITGGEVDITSSLEYIKREKFNYIIAVDGGLCAAKSLGLIPDLIIGDFDTIAPNILMEFNEKSKIIRLNPEKDDTDTCEAFNQAILLNPKEIHIFGGIGSRFDHSMANIFLLKKARELSIDAYIISKLNKISVINNKKIFKKEDAFGKYISFIQFDGSAYGITLKGFKYPLLDFDFDTNKTYRLGISNEYEADICEIDIKKGFILAIEAKDDRVN